MKQLFLMAAALLMFAITSFPSLAAEKPSAIRPLQDRRPISNVVNVAEGQFSSQPIQVNGPVSRALEMNRQKNVFIMRTVFGR